nr:hypothetical protein [Serratia proteamaculans]ULG15860.1 SefI [Serratia proteamaculans]ULG19125.1 SefI [Serratia proteamaculans]
MRYRVAVLFNFILLLFFSCGGNAYGSGIFNINYNSDNTYTISKGDSWSNWSLRSNYCKKNYDIGLQIKFEEAGVSSHNSSTVPGVNTQVIGGTGDCAAAIGNLLPYKASLPSGTKKGIYCLMVYYIPTTGSLGLVDSFCMGLGSGFDVTVEDASCEITSGDIIHDYGTLLSDEVEGKSMTTNAVVSCSAGASVGAVNVELSMENEFISLKDDNSIFAEIDINGNGKSATIDIDVNTSTNLSVTSTLHTNGNVSSGAFSGSSVLTMTYY